MWRGLLGLSVGPWGATASDPVVVVPTEGVRMAALRLPVKVTTDSKLAVVTVGGTQSVGSGGSATAPLPQLPVATDANGYLCARIVG